MNLTEKTKSFIKNFYFIIANTLILLTIIVVCAHMILKWQAERTDYDYAHNRSKVVRQDAYGHMSNEEINDLLNATWTTALGGWQYDEWVGFKEAPRKTRFVNVNKYGIRQNSNTSIKMEALDNAIWFFGGSTTFGYGVTDQETIPAKLEKILNTRVYNFGRGYFYSEQENQLLNQYLMAGYRPKLVIFLDGINERCDIDVYQEQMEDMFEQANEYSWELEDAISPISILTDKFMMKFGLKNMQAESVISQGNMHHLSCTSYGKTQPLSNVLEWNLLERKSICDRYSVNCKTFVQPFAGVHGVHSEEATLSTSDRKEMRDKFALLKSTWAKSGAIFVTNALDNFHKHAYVDDVHYSAEACELIAKEIAKKLGN